MKKSPENEAFLIKNECFFGILNFYARKLGYDDALNDLQIFLLELQLSRGELPDPYVKKCLKNEYIRLSKKRQNRNVLEVEYFDFSVIDYDFDFRVDFKSALNELTALQREILLLHLYGGYTVSEIAIFKGISRQAVNCCRLRAFEKMRCKLKSC